MTSPLTCDDIVDIMSHLKDCYSLISPNWSHSERDLMDLIKQSAVVTLRSDAIKDVLQEVEHRHDKDIWREYNERIYRSCFVLILRKRSSELLLTTIADLLVEFPEFSGCASDELDLLLKFRNMMLCGIRLFSAKANKGKLMEIAGRLSGKMYTTGGGSTIEAKRREKIYEKLGGVTKKKLTVPRKKKNSKEALGGDKHGANNQKSFRPKRIHPSVVRAFTRSIRKVSPGQGSASSMSTSSSESTSSSSPSAVDSTLTERAMLEDPDLMLLEPMVEDGGDCFLSNTWVEVIRDCGASKQTYKGGGFSPDATPQLPRHAPFDDDDDDSPYEGDGEWSLSLCLRHPKPADPSPSPSLQRALSLTLDFSKPIFVEDMSFTSVH
jgi:hypothetical protein